MDVGPWIYMYWGPHLFISKCSFIILYITFEFSAMNTKMIGQIHFRIGKCIHWILMRVLSELIKVTDSS